MLGFLLACAITVQVTPLPRAHSHNDYLRNRPLAAALENGFGSVEADVCLVGGELLVAHEPSSARRGRTLEKLYLEPLRRRVAAEGGRVYRHGPLEFRLLIDIKTAPDRVLPVLERELGRYAALLTSFDGRRKTPRAVTVLLSGRTPKLRPGKRRYAFDGGYEPIAPYVSPLCSQPFTREFTWRGNGTFPAAQRAALLRRVAQVHAQGRLLRFWAVPNKHAVWTELWSAGVDVMHTDNLRGMRDFLLARRDRAPPAPWQPVPDFDRPGIRVFRLATRTPLRAFAVIVDLTAPAVTLVSLRAKTDDGRASVTDLAQQSGSYVAVNAHYFALDARQHATTRMWFVDGGKTITAPCSTITKRKRTWPVARAAIWWQDQRRPRIGWIHARAGRVFELQRPFDNGADVPAQDDSIPDSATQVGPVRAAIQAGPMLVRWGLPAVTRHEEQLFAAADTRHPRTAVGTDGTRLFLLVVDGRYRQSRGVTLVRLAEMMRTLGARDALNLDGGGSSTLAIDGKLINRPVGRTGQRPVPSGLGVRLGGNGDR